MRSCRPVAIEGDVVVLAFGHNFHRTKVEEDRNRRMVEETLSKLVGQRYRVRCVLGQQERAPRTPQRTTSKSASEEAALSAEQIVADDPVVRAAVEDLGAQIVQRRE